MWSAWATCNDENEDDNDDDDNSTNNTKKRSIEEGAVRGKKKIGRRQRTMRKRVKLNQIKTPNHRASRTILGTLDYGKD